MPRRAESALFHSRNTLKELIAAKLGEVDIVVYPLRGLCSFYAEKGGILIGIEEN